jgi:hypothetical protein
MQQSLPAAFLEELAKHEEVLVTSRDGNEYGTVPVWFLIEPPGVVYVFTFAFSIKARRWARDPWARLRIASSQHAIEGKAHRVEPEEISDSLADRIVERWAMQGATTVPGLRRTLRDQVHALFRIEAS